MRIYWNKIAKAKRSTTEGKEKNWTMSNRNNNANNNNNNDNNNKLAVQFQSIIEFHHTLGKVTRSVGASVAE